MKLRVEPNDETGLWEIHDESGFLCKLESESTAALIVNAVPELVEHAREGRPITLRTVRAAIRNANNINPLPAFRRKPTKKGPTP